ncbi:hypothetical protein ACTTAM_08310 [Rhodobacter capsulatus]|uniref:hypothetical protein n=1 Tax=Rhodobacter capsulatus TaxID=1061 RepID=UPI0040269FA5
MRVLGPVPGAVSVAEFKRATHMDEGTEDDAALAACLAAAQSLVEQATNRPLGPREVEITLEAVPGLRRWWFPLRAGAVGGAGGGRDRNGGAGV